VGRSVSLYPIYVRYCFVDTSSELSSNQVLFSVPKKNIKLSVHRNRIKRLMREAYRLSKGSVTLVNEPGVYAVLYYKYVGKDSKPSYSLIESLVLNSLIYISNLRDYGTYIEYRECH
jgi:ribonuclease P protein component